MDPDTLKKLEEAVGQAWADYKVRHPRLARRIEQAKGNPVVIMTAALQRNEEFAALLAKTDQEVDIGRIVKAVLSTAWQIARELLVAV